MPINSLGPQWETRKPQDLQKASQAQEAEQEIQVVEDKRTATESGVNTENCCDCCNSNKEDDNTTEKITETLSDAMDNAQSELQSAISSYEQCSQDFADAQSALQTAESALASFQAQFELQDPFIYMLPMAMTEPDEAQLAQLQEEVQLAHDKFVIAEAKMNEAKEALDEAQHQAQTLQETMGNLNEKLGDDDEGQDDNALKQKIEEYNKQIEELNKKLEEIQESDSEEDSTPKETLTSKIGIRKLPETPLMDNEKEPYTKKIKDLIPNFEEITRIERMTKNILS